MTRLASDSLTTMPNDVASSLPPSSFSRKQSKESLQDRVRRVNRDMEELQDFNIISVTQRTYEEIRSYLLEEQDDLKTIHFDSLSTQDQGDYLLLRNYLKRQIRQVELSWQSKDEIMPALPFASTIAKVSHAREDVEPLKPQALADALDQVEKMIKKVTKEVEDEKITMSKPSGYRTVKVIAELRQALQRIDEFYAGWKPLYDWWVRQPFDAVIAALDAYVPVVQRKLAGQHPDQEDEIIGRPIGRESLLVELEAEMIAYSPEELIQLAQDQYQWAEKEMKKASRELGYHDDWKKALEHTKNDCVPPGQQDQLVKELGVEAETYVKKHDLVTVPKLARSTHRKIMMTPALQKTTPFLTGGWATSISYPVSTMSHDLKKMVMRGNSRGMTHAVVFHEEIPGHRLQLFTADRKNNHRWLFMTPFIVEGWGMYWEMNLWKRGDFFTKPVDKIGTLFWRMHRSARIIFSLQFHLGQITPEEMIDGLVNRVGHERSTAESEVRRWINGEWAPLYQCGYMVGALQLMALREEALASGKYESDKHFNDEVLANNFMPVELMRALLLGKPLDADYKPHWKFYGEL